MILAIFVSFFIVVGVIALPQLILKECGELTIKKSIIVRVITSFVYFALIIFLINYFDSKDQNIEFFEYLKNFFKTYSKTNKDFTLANIWEGLLIFSFIDNVVWVAVFMFFPQLTLLIPQFLFIKFKEYAEYEEVAVTNRVEVSVNGYGDVSAREANIYNTIRPYLWKTVVAVIASVAIFIPILYVIIKYISPIYAMVIVIVIDILILILTCRKKRVNSAEINDSNL